MIVLLNLHLRVQSSADHHLSWVLILLEAWHKLAINHGHADELLVLLNLLHDVSLLLLHHHLLIETLLLLDELHLLVIVQLDFLNDHEVLPVYLLVNLHRHRLLDCFLTLLRRLVSPLLLLIFLIFVPKVPISRSPKH